MANNNYDDVYKVTKELQNSLKLNEDIESAYKATKTTMESVYETIPEAANKLAKFMKDMYDPLNTSVKLFNWETALGEGMHNIRKAISDIDTKKLSKISEQLELLPLPDVQGISKSLRQFADMDYFVEFKNFSIDFETYDFTRLSKIMKDSLSQIDWSQAVSVDEITEEVAEQYIEEELAEKAYAGEKDSIVQNIQIDKHQIKKDIRDTVSFWISIISLLLTICGFINSRPTVVNNTYNNITEVTYNYTIDMGIDAEVLNALGYRIINRNNVMPRIKPDCSSTVTGHLYIGQVVNVTGKWKKWIEITWKNDNGEYCSGWVQNYKVSEFR